MGKRSLYTSLQKVHTFASDLEVVRTAQNANSAPATPVPVSPQPTPQPKTPTVVSTKTTPPNNALMVLKEVPLPAIRTMVSDTARINSLKPVPSASKKTPVPRIPSNATVPPSPKPKATAPTYVTNPTTIPPKPTEPAKGNVLTDTKNETPALIKTMHIATKTVAGDNIHKTTDTPKTIAVGKETRDSTYAATMITNTKRKRFSLWRELGKKVTDLIQKKSTAKKNNYTAPIVPLRKGMVQPETIKVAGTSIAEYSALKKRVKDRVEKEESENGKKYDLSSVATTIINPSFDNGEQLPENAVEIEKTRSQLLSTIEREVSEHHDPLSTPFEETDTSPIFVKTKPLAHGTNSYRDEFGTLVGWEHYTEETKGDVDHPIVVTEPANDGLLSPAPSVLVIPIPKEMYAATSSPDSSIPHKLIQPTIPTLVYERPTEKNISTEVPPPDVDYFTKNNVPIDATASTEVTEGDHSYGKPVNTFVPPATDTPQVEAEDAPHNLPTLVFTQPKIIPTLPTEVTPKPNRSQPPITSVAQSFPIQPTNNSLPSQTPIVQTDTLQGAVSPQIVPQKKNLTYPPAVAPTQGTPSRMVQFITQYTQIFILAGLVIATLIVVGGIGISSFVSTFNSSPNTTTSHHYLNSSAVHLVLINPINSLVITEQIARHNNAIGVSEIILQNKDSIPLSPAIISTLLQLPLDPAFTASLLDFRFGWYREEPFIVLRYSGDSTARGALLQWERTMYTDLLPLFGTKTERTGGVFKDEVINTIDVRRQYSAAENTQLIYGVVAPGHILITTSEMAFLNLSNNFNVR